MNLSRFAAVVAIACATAAPGQETPREDAGSPPAVVRAAPSADEIRRVLDYQENGKDAGPVLLELIACLKVDIQRGSPTQFNCLEAVSGPIKRGTAVNAWTSWFCPRGGAYDDLAIQFMHEGVVRQTVDLKVEGLSRTRTYRAHTFSKVGRWQIRVSRGEQTLAVRDVTVVN